MSVSPPKSPILVGMGRMRCVYVMCVFGGDVCLYLCVWREVYVCICV